MSSVDEILVYDFRMGWKKIFPGMFGRHKRHSTGKSFARRQFGSRKAFRKAKRMGAAY